MRALEITVTVFNDFNDVESKLEVFTIIPEDRLDRDVVKRLFSKRYATSLPDNRFIWSVTRRIEFTEVEL